MEVQFGKTTDIASWIALVKEVKWNFPGLETEEDLEGHAETVRKFMSQNRALCVKDGDMVVGVLLFSRKRNMICFLAVKPEYRRRGVASALMMKALGNLDRNKDIVVSTFREGDAKGTAPRALYKKFGFIEGELIEEFGYPCQAFTLHSMKNTSYEIVILSNRKELKEKASEWFSAKWGIPLEAYLESIEASFTAVVPSWYVCLHEGRIVAGMGVIENDFHERKDLTPNVCAVYTEQEFRNRGIAGKLLEFVCEDMHVHGIDRLYLLTDHTGFYERYGWKFHCLVRGDDAEEPSRMYIHEYENTTIRRFIEGDETAVSSLICRTLANSNSRDYSPEFIEENIRSHSPEVMRQRAVESHFYVVCRNGEIIGCGGITGYWGSTTESYLVSIFVAPEHQGKGIGRQIMSRLELDEYFLRAWRTEVGASLTAMNFYRHLGYSFKNACHTPDKFGVVHMEKFLALESERLVIAPMLLDELKATVESQESPELRQAFQEMLDACLEAPEHRIWYTPWKISMADTPSEVIGELGFRGPAVNGEVEIGYGLHPGFEGRGYMTEAVRTVIQWAFSLPGITAIVAETSTDNIPSQRILSRLGFVQCGMGKEGPLFRKGKS